MKNGADTQPAGVRLATQILSSVQLNDPVTPSDDDEQAETSSDDVNGAGVRDAPGGEGVGAGPGYVAVQIHQEEKREEEPDVTHTEGDQEDDQDPKTGRQEDDRDRDLPRNIHIYTYILYLMSLNDLLYIT